MSTWIVRNPGTLLISLILVAKPLDFPMGDQFSVNRKVKEFKKQTPYKKIQHNH